MWKKLESPPQNMRHYKYTDNSAEQHQPFKEINLDQNRTTLFQPRVKDVSLSSVQEESLFSGGKEAVSANTTNKAKSFLKSTAKGKHKNHESNFELKIKGRNSEHNGHTRQKSKSMLTSKQKSSVNLSKKNLSSSIIREEASRLSGSSKNGRLFLKRVQNQQQDESFSQIMANEVSMVRGSTKDKENMDKSFFYQMMTTLREIRDISKQSLNTKKKLVKLIQDRSQVSFLYDRQERSEIYPHNKKQKNERKSIKRVQQKSTVKKLGKSIVFEQRLVKIQQKLRTLSRRYDQDCLPKKTSAQGFGRTSKKSTSAIR